MTQRIQGLLIAYSHVIFCIYVLSPKLESNSHRQDMCQIQPGISQMARLVQSLNNINDKMRVLHVSILP